MRAIVALLLMTGAAAAQQPDPAALQRLLASIEQQRNNALNQAAVADARAAQMAEEVQRLRAELEKLKPKE
jgi:uncharacterized lipoprotein YajG